MAINQTDRSPEGVRLRQSTIEKIALIAKLLRAGKSPKEVAWQLKVQYKLDSSWEDVKVLIHRTPDLHTAYVEAYPLRFPNSPEPPPKILKPELRAIEL